MSQNTRYAKWDANSGATTFTQTDEPVGLPPSAQLPRPGPVKRFVQWLRALLLRRRRAWLIEELSAMRKAEGDRYLQAIFMAMENAHAATLWSIERARRELEESLLNAAPQSPKSMQPPAAEAQSPAAPKHPPDGAR